MRPGVPTDAGQRHSGVGGGLDDGFAGSGTRFAWGRRGQPCTAPRQPETWGAASPLSRTSLTCSRWTDGNVALWTSLAWAIRCPRWSISRTRWIGRRTRLGGTFYVEFSSVYGSSGGEGVVPQSVNGFLFNRGFADRSDSAINLYPGGMRVE